MKRINLYIICFLPILLWSQDVKIESGSEEMDTVKFSSLIKTYEKVIMTEREEKTLVKVDLLGPFFYVLSGIDSSKHNAVRVSFEQKFKPEWSWIAAFDAQVNRYAVTEVRYNAGVRYYFNMQKRILKGKSADNFSANYISPRVSYRRRPKINQDQISIDLLFGIQRRLWKYGFLDFDIGFENLISSFENDNFGVGITSSLQLGIALRL